MPGREPSNGPWDNALDQVREWDVAWAASCARMIDIVRNSGVLPQKTVALIGVALSAACTNLDAEGARRHIRSALAAGANRDEVLTVIKMASLLAIHSCSLGAPILLEEAAAAGIPTAAAAGPVPVAPACDRMRAMGQWDAAWDPFFALDPKWTDAFMGAGSGIYASGVLEPKLVELLSIAFDASFTHMYAPGTRRHIRAAFRLGASVAEVMAVLELCVAHGMQACNLGVPILAEELERHQRDRSP